MTNVSRQGLLFFDIIIIMQVLSFGIKHSQMSEIYSAINVKNLSVFSICISSDMCFFAF